MYRDFWVIITVIIIIVILDIVSNNYTVKAMTTISGELEELKSVLYQDNEEKTHNQIKKIEDDWHHYHQVLAYYLEHDELEKVETQLSVLKGKIEQKEYDNCLEEIETMTFILGHIQEKEQFSVQSIF